MADPLRITTFTLTRADALAYERYARPMGWRRTAGLILWLALAAPILWLIPNDWSGNVTLPAFWALAAVVLAILYTLAMIAWTMGDMRRARRRVRTAHEVTMEEYTDRLEVTGAGIPRYVNFAEVAKPVVTPTHLFIGSGPNAVIIPRRAFAEEESFDALAARLQGAAISNAAATAARKTVPPPRNKPPAEVKPVTPPGEPEPTAAIDPNPASA